MHYLYITCRSDNLLMSVGTTTKIKEVAGWYNKIPSLKPHDEAKLVYLEYGHIPQEIQDRFDLIFQLPMEDKIELVKSINPDFIPLVIGQNIDVPL